MADLTILPGLAPAEWSARTANQGIFKAHFQGELQDQ